MSEFWTLLYYVFGFLTINSLFLIIPYIAPGISPSDIIPYQIFFVALVIFNLTLPSYKMVLPFKRL